MKRLRVLGEVKKGLYILKSSQSSSKDRNQDFSQFKVNCKQPSNPAISNSVFNSKKLVNVAISN